MQDWNGSATGFIQRLEPCPALNVGKVRSSNTGKPECSKAMSSLRIGGRVMWALFWLTGKGAGNNCLFSPFWLHFSNGAVNSRYSWDPCFYPTFLQFFPLAERLCGFLHCLPWGGKKIVFCVPELTGLEQVDSCITCDQKLCNGIQIVLILSVPFQKIKASLLFF